MALDFPATPTTNQKYPASPVAGVPTYTWDGEKWTTKADAIAGDSYVKKIGDTMSGPLVLPADPVIALHSATKQYVDARVGGMSAADGLQINGGMEVSQERGNTAFALTNSVAKYVQDGWYGYFATASTLAMAAYPQNANAPPGFRNSLVLAVQTPQATLAAGDISVVMQYIEGTRFARMAWGTANARPLTIGFWVNSTTLATIAVTIRNAASDRSYVTDVTINAANTWEYKTFTVPGDTSGTWPTTNASSASIIFCNGSGSASKGAANTWLGVNATATNATTNMLSVASANLYITGVTLLPGTLAPTAAQSPLLMRPYGEELLICQRYYFLTSANSTWPSAGATYAMAYRVSHPVTMRVVPTIVRTTIGSVTNIASTTIASFMEYSDVGMSAQGAGNANYNFNYYADARL